MAESTNIKQFSPKSAVTKTSPRGGAVQQTYLLRKIKNMNNKYNINVKFLLLIYVGFFTNTTH